MQAAMLIFMHIFQINICLNEFNRREGNCELCIVVYDVIELRLDDDFVSVNAEIVFIDLVAIRSKGKIFSHIFLKTINFPAK